jgi:hypothetical protein
MMGLQGNKNGRLEALDVVDHQLAGVAEVLEKNRGESRFSTGCMAICGGRSLKKQTVSGFKSMRTPFRLRSKSIGQS